MRPAWIVAAALVLSGCAGNYQTTFDHPPEAEPISVHIVPILNQEEMNIQVVVTDSSSVGAQYGIVGALVTSVMDSVINAAAARRAERQAEFVRELTSDYDFVFTAQQSALNIGQSKLWQIKTVNQPIATEEENAIATEILASGDTDVVVLLDISYALTPSLNRVRADVIQNVYLRSSFIERGKARASSSRTMTYLSPSHPLNYRPFEEGEKDKLIAALREDYQRLIDAQPDQAGDLEKALNKELEDLEESETITDDIAIRETWTTALLTKYLDQSMQHTAEMIRLDWTQRIVPEEAERIEDQFLVVTTSGILVNEKGHRIGELDDNIIYRTQWGSIYSLPAAW